MDFFTTYCSPVGILNIHASEHALRAVLFEKGTKPAQQWMPQQIEHQNKIIETCCRQLDEYFTGEKKSFDLPLEQNGTYFQQNVWNELLKIQYGKTISYLELSKRIGNAKAIRAVGTTNGKNQIAIIVPCHRVIGSNGELTGYAGELWRKKWLLDHESKYANGLQTLF